MARRAITRSRTAAARSSGTGVHSASALLPHLYERQRRLYLATEAKALGHGGAKAVARLAEVPESTVARGRAELAEGAEPLGRVRRAGGGRKSATERDPGLVAALEALIEPREIADPVSPLRWTTASLRDLAGELAAAGHPASAPLVGRLLHQLGFSLQGMAKTRAGAQVPDRDAQFRHINTTVGSAPGPALARRPGRSPGPVQSVLRHARRLPGCEHGSRA